MRPRLSARFLFAGIGAAACLLAALALNGVYARAHSASWAGHDATPLLLFFPHLRNDTERRLREANAKSGDVEITLTWNNLNDLDLHCIDPNNQHVFYGTTMAALNSATTRGVLDVDQNRAPPYMQQPVEHIYWPRGAAPAGRYRVYVDHYARHGGADPTRYQVTVKEYGRIHQYSGEISHTAHRDDLFGKEICEFTTGRTAFAFLGMPPGFWRSLLVIAAWAAAIVATLAAALLAGLFLFYRRVYRKRFLKVRDAVRIIAVGAAWAAIGGALAQILFTLLPDEFARQHPSWSHAAGLLVLAAVAGLALGGRVPHLRRGSAFLAGVLGGALAGRLFLLVYWTFGESVRSEAWGRAAAAALIGGLIGFMIALVVEKPPEPEVPIEVEDNSLAGMQPLSLRANRIGPSGRLRRAGVEPTRR